jgi:flagellar protein FlgJ
MADGIPITGVPAAPPALPEPTAEMRKAAEEFESMVLGQLLQPMFQALDANGLGGGGFGEEIFRPMLVEEYAKSISHSGGVGLAQSVLTELQRLQLAQQVQPEAADGAAR